MAAEVTSSSYSSIRIQIQVQMEWLRKTLFLPFSKWSQSSAAPILFFIFMGKQVQILYQSCLWKQSRIGSLLASMWIRINTRTKKREENFYKSNWTAFKTVWRYPITWMRLFTIVDYLNSSYMGMGKWQSHVKPVKMWDQDFKIPLQKT